LHCLRTFELGDLLATRRPGINVDREILFVAAMLHDIGLTDAPHNEDAVKPNADMIPIDSTCFAVAGAAVAERLAGRYHWSQTRTDRLTEAISLHLNVRVPLMRGVEAHLLNAASAYDTIRLGAGRFRHEGEAISDIESRLRRTSDFCVSLRVAWEGATRPRVRTQYLTKYADFKGRLARAC
jgi:hypothetical protein